jgi:hypothetical protein
VRSWDEALLARDLGTRPATWQPVTASKLRREIPGAVTPVYRYAIAASIVLPTLLFIVILVLSPRPGHWRFKNTSAVAAREPLTGTLTFIGRAELGEQLYQHAHAIRSRIADAPARAAGSRQPICSAKATMMPAGPRR